MHYFIFIFLIFSTYTGYSKEIAITFDDSPRLAKGYFDGPTRSKILIGNLKKSGLKDVAFFSVSANLDDEGRKRLEEYSNAGHIIANHTHDHPDFNITNSGDYITNFKKADAVLSAYKNFVKWFRFPYLREGNDLEKRNKMRETLDNMDYFNAYITINNYDWYMEEQFQKSIKKYPKLSFEKLKKYYIQTLMEAIEYYDSMAQKHLGRSPKHVILLHETDLNALFIADIVAELKNSNWNIISPKEAYQDDIAKYKSQTIFKFNPGRVGEIAKDKGQKDGLWHESCDEQFLDDRFEKEVLSP